MSANLVATVGTAEGRLLHVVRGGNAIAITDNPSARTLTRSEQVMSPEHAQGLADVLVQATEDDKNQGARLIGTIGRVSVVRWPHAVALTDHPEPLVHSGWTMRVDQARELAEALLTATSDDERPSEPSTAVESGDAAALLHPEHVDDGPGYRETTSYAPTHRTAGHRLP